MYLTVNNKIKDKEKNYIKKKCFNCNGLGFIESTTECCPDDCIGYDSEFGEFYTLSSESCKNCQGEGYIYIKRKNK